ncbi:unnamed protein product [Ectocarpus sp. 12 AP-2014]
MSVFVGGIFLIFRLLCPPIQLEWAVEKLTDCPAVAVILSYPVLSYPIHKRDFLLATWIRIIHSWCGLSCCAIFIWCRCFDCVVRCLRPCAFTITCVVLSFIYSWVG